MQMGTSQRLIGLQKGDAYAVQKNIVFQKKHNDYYDGWILSPSKHRTSHLKLYEWSKKSVKMRLILKQYFIFC